MKKEREMTAMSSTAAATIKTCAVAHTNIAASQVKQFKYLENVLTYLNLDDPYVYLSTMTGLQLLATFKYVHH